MSNSPYSYDVDLSSLHSSNNKLPTISTLYGALLESHYFPSSLKPYLSKTTCIEAIKTTNPMVIFIVGCVFRTFAGYCMGEYAVLLTIGAGAAVYGCMKVRSDEVKVDEVIMRHESVKIGMKYVENKNMLKKNSSHLNSSSSSSANPKYDDDTTVILKNGRLQPQSTTSTLYSTMDELGDVIVKPRRLIKKDVIVYAGKREKSSNRPTKGVGKGKIGESEDKKGVVVDSESVCVERKDADEGVEDLKEE